MLGLTFVNIDVSAIANILVAFSTFVLAFITLKTVNLMKKQTVFTQKQTLLTLSAQNPILKITDFNIRENKIFLKLKNIGKGNAYQIGVHSKFLLAKSNLKAYDKNKKVHLVDFSYDTRILVDEFEGNKNNVVDNGYVNYVSNKNLGVIILRPEDELEVSIEPKFYLKYPLNIGRSIARIIIFKDLIDFFKRNNERFFSIYFELVYKNGLEDLQEISELANFVFDIETNKTLEDAFRQNYQVNFRTLTTNDLQIKIGGIGYDQYKSMKSMRNFIPGEKND